MAETMTTPGMTDGQINRALEIFKAQLVKHATELPSEDVQTVFGQKDLGPEWLTVLRKRVEAVSSMIVRKARVDRSRTPQQALDATGRRQYVDQAVVTAMPRGGNKEVEVCFFKPRPEAYDKDGWLSEEALEREFEFNGFKPDPLAQAAVNEADPAFANEYPNGTHWQDENGKWCFAAFSRDGDERRVGVGRRDDGWSDRWWFGGVRK